MKTESQHDILNKHESDPPKVSDPTAEPGAAGLGGMKCEVCGRGFESEPLARCRQEPLKVSRIRLVSTRSTADRISWLLSGKDRSDSEKLELAELMRDCTRGMATDL